MSRYRPSIAGGNPPGVFLRDTVTFTITRVSDGEVVMSHSHLDANATAVAFDTLAVYVARTNATFDLFVSTVDIERVVVP